MIAEELSDVYLGYLYDQGLRRGLISKLVTRVFNTTEEGEEHISVMDPQLTAEYVCDFTRDHEMSNESCFFGRVSLPRCKNEDGDNILAQGRSPFVYTGCTVRLVE